MTVQYAADDRQCELRQAVGSGHQVTISSGCSRSNGYSRTADRPVWRPATRC